MAHPETPWFGYDYGGCSLLLDTRKELEQA